MADKKKTKREKFSAIDAIRNEVRRGAGEDCEQAAARAAQCLAALRERGFAPVVERTRPWARFLADHGEPVSLERRPAPRAEIEQVETLIGCALPLSYREFMTTWGCASFMRMNPEESARVLALDESRHLRDLLRQPFADAFAANSPPTGPTPWAPRITRALSRAEGARAVFWPVCPYYGGAFGIALGLGETADRAPFVCWNPGYRPSQVTPYGTSMQEWFSEMVDWTITEMLDWMIASA